jgi:hypothetical protein
LIATLRDDLGAARSWLDQVDALSVGITKANDLGANATYRAMLLLAEERYEEAWAAARDAARTPENLYAWGIGAQAALRLRDAGRMRDAVSAVEGVVGDWYEPTVNTVHAWSALAEGRRTDAVGAFTAARDAYRRQQDLANELMAAVGLVAALGEDAPEGRAESDRLRATLRDLRADWLLRWLDDVVAQGGGSPGHEGPRPATGARDGHGLRSGSG